MRSIQRDDGTVEEVAPTHCPNGHELKDGTVLISGDVQYRTYRCRVCGLMIVTPHGIDEWWVVQKPPG